MCFSQNIGFSYGFPYHFSSTFRFTCGVCPPTGYEPGSFHCQYPLGSFLPATFPATFLAISSIQNSPNASPQPTITIRVTPKESLTFPHHALHQQSLIYSILRPRRSQFSVSMSPPSSPQPPSPQGPRRGSRIILISSTTPPPVGTITPYPHNQQVTRQYRQ